MMKLCKIDAPFLCGNYFEVGTAHIPISKHKHHWQGCQNQLQRTVLLILQNRGWVLGPFLHTYCLNIQLWPWSQSTKYQWTAIKRRDKPDTPFFAFKHQHPSHFSHLQYPNINFNLSTSPSVTSSSSIASGLLTTITDTHLLPINLWMLTTTMPANPFEIVQFFHLYW